MTWMRAVIAAVVVGLLVAAGMAVRSHLIGVGEARVQARWDAQKKVDLEETLRLERERDSERMIKFRNAERIADEQAKREGALRQRIAAGNAVADSLQHTIDRLNRRDLSEAGSDPRSVALAQGAATARELLGSCTERYRWLGAEADRLRDQVAGLQDDAMYVCRTPQQTNTTESALEHLDH